MPKYFIQKVFRKVFPITKKGKEEREERERT